MPVARTAFGITYYAYSLQEWRKLRTLKDIPRSHFPILKRRANNFQLQNRVDYRDGAWPQLGGVDHIGAGFQDNSPIDLGAERLTEYGLNPNNKVASWHGAVDSNSIVMLAPGDVRPWVHGVSGSPYDLNSYGIGVEDGVLSTNWNTFPEPKRTAHLRMRAAFWALFFGDLGWELKYTSTAAGVWDHIRRGKSWGLTQHGIVDWNNRTDAGLLWAGGGRKTNTFPYDTLLKMIREEMAIRAGGNVSTPGLPDTSARTKKLQGLLNDVLGYRLDKDGSFGPLTTTAATEAAKDTGFTGDIKSAAFVTHLEKIMSKIDELAKDVAALTAEVKAVRAEQKKTPERVWTHALYGFAAHWWLRRGSLGARTDHKNFPADPGSPADVDRQVAAKVLGKDIPPYTGGK